METLHEYLDNEFQRRDDVSDSEIKEAKKAYQKKYGREYQGHYAEKNSRVRAVVTKEKFNFYTQHAKAKGLKLSDLVKMSLDVACMTGINSSNNEVCALSYKLRDIIEEYQHENEIDDLGEAIDATNQIIDKSCGH